MDIVLAAIEHPFYLILPSLLIASSIVLPTPVTLGYIALTLPVIGYLRIKYDHQIYWIFGLIIPFSLLWLPLTIREYLNLESKSLHDHADYIFTVIIPIGFIHILCSQAFDRRKKNSWFFANVLSFGFAYYLFLIIRITKRNQAHTNGVSNV
ncbi:MAG TPA: hypothetical protein DCX06_01090 [Opitutae bacterium]|nr:hypothetical protein [Opitutae bacterium]